MERKLIRMPRIPKKIMVKHISICDVLMCKAYMINTQIFEKPNKNE